MALRFKHQYAETINGRLSYELVSDEVEYNDDFKPCYNLILLGLVPEYLLEPAEVNDIPAIDIWITLTNK